MRWVVDVIAPVIIFAVLIFAANQQQEKRFTPVMLNAQNQVDITRWRDDGSQPIAFVNNGNGNQNASTLGYVRSLKRALESDPAW